MPQLGVAGGSQLRDAFNNFKQREKRRTTLDPLPFATQQASEANSVYIYNVGWMDHSRDLASMGKRLIPGIPKEKVFKGLEVSKPLKVEGMPWEPYPMEDLPVRLFSGKKYTQEMQEDASLIPTGVDGKRIKNPGFDLAMEICGHGMGQHPSMRLDRFGVFISEFPEPKGKPLQPGKPVKDTAEALMAYGNALAEYQKEAAQYALWEKMVRDAQERLRKTCLEEVQEAKNVWQRGSFDKEYPEVRRAYVYTCAELTGADPKTNAWLGASMADIKPKVCIGCAELLDAGALICSKCSTRQVSDEVFEAEMKKRRG